MKFPHQAKLLKDMRHDGKYTLKQMSAVVNIQATRIHRLESGKFDLSVKELLAYEKIQLDAVPLLLGALRKDFA